MTSLTSISTLKQMIKTISGLEQLIVMNVFYFVRRKSTDACYSCLMEFMYVFDQQKRQFYVIRVKKIEGILYIYFFREKVTF